MSCFSCAGAGTGDDDEAKLLRQRSKQIDAELRKEKKTVKNTYRLLVLGPGESGKSTFIKQMKILHAKGFDDDDRRSYIPDIRDNVKAAIKSITGAMMTLDPPVELADPEANQDSLYFMQAQSRRSIFDDSGDEFVEHVKKLWKDAGVQACLRRSSEYLLYDSAEYFLNQVDTIYSQDYLPTDQDILRCRKITSGVFETRCIIDSVCFHFFDVGGQREERRKWIQCFNDITVIIYIASCSAFDMFLREDESQNQLREAIELIGSLWRNRWLRYLSHILFLNKQDQLESKIESHGKEELLKHFPEYSDFKPSKSSISELDKVKEFILDLFIEAVTDSEGNDNVARHIYPHFTTAIDTKNMKRVFNDTKVTIGRIVLDQLSGKKESLGAEHWVQRNLKEKRKVSNTSASSALT